MLFVCVVLQCTTISTS